MSTKSQVAETKAKEWTPIYYGGSEWVEYEGMDDADAIVIPKITSIDENALYTLQVKGLRVCMERKEYLSWVKRKCW